MLGDSLIRLAARLRSGAALAGRARPVPAAEAVWQATRAGIATEGFGARLLALQDPRPVGRRRVLPATSTSARGGRGRGPAVDGDDLVAERAARVGPRRRRARRTRPTLLAANSRWEYDDLPYWGGEVDCCINAWTLANGVWLGADVEGIADVVRRAPAGRRRLELRVGRGLDAVVVPLDAELAQGPARLRGRDRRHGRDARRPPRRRGVPARSGGCCAGCRPASWSAPWVTRFAYPFRWFYSVLNAADYFRAASAARRHARPTRGWRTRSR